MSKPKYNYAEFLEAKDYVKDIESKVNSGELKLSDAMENKLNNTMSSIREYEESALAEINAIDEDDYKQDCDDAF